jgi:uncharacterized membrane protein
MNKRMHCFLTRLFGLIIGVEVVCLPILWWIMCTPPVDLSNRPVQEIWSGGFGIQPFVGVFCLIGLVICLYYHFKPCMIRNDHDKPD